MIKINIFTMERFLEVVDRCEGPVYLQQPNGGKVDIVKSAGAWDNLRQRHKDNSGYLKVSLEIPKVRDYLSIVHYAIADI